MSDFDSSSRVKGQNRQVDTADDSLAPDKDLIMEQILENLNTTPIGKVLKRVASLPDGRREKVLDVRQQLTEGKYEFNEYLDVALDKVLEDLTAK
jgi:hypothetical protein